MKKNEKLFDAIGQIDERYIAEALEPMYQESVGTSDENKAAMPKKGKLFFYRQRRTAAVAPDADENQGAAADQNAVQGRMANNAETCFAEIYLEVATANSGKITWRIVNESDTETVGWGTDYTLERFTENGWEIVENSDADLETQKESSQAVAGETKEGTLDLAADGIRLEAGQYRLKKECRIFDDENSRQTELTAEFQVEP